VRERVTWGPLEPRRAWTTRHLIHAPCSYFSPGTCSGAGSSASNRSCLPESISTSTLRGSSLCCTFPEIRSPSRAAKSWNTASSLASRSRCAITWRAVEAATRPKSRGVLSNSGPVGLPASSSSRTQTETWPDLRSNSTRARE
jgi:hypothetical protein